MYSIEIHPAMKLVHTILEGHWTIDIVEAFQADVTKALHQRGLLPADCVCLSQSEAFSVPSKDVADRLARLFNWSKFAIVSPSAIVRLQIARLFPADVTRVFATEAEARDWLFGQVR